MIEQVSFNGQPVSLVSEVDLNRDRLESLSRTVTSMELLGSSEVSPDSPRVEYRPSNTVSIEYDEITKTIIIAGPEESFSRGDAILYAAEYLATCLQSSQRGTFLTHAAAVYDETSDTSTVLFGEKGAGKTTVALRLCIEGGRQLIGNDQVYIGANETGINTEGGNQWFNVRETAIKSDAFLAGILSKKDRDESKPAWNDKVRIDLADIGVVGRQEAARVERLYHLRLDPTQKELYVAPWDGVQRNLILHEKVGRHILSQATPFQDDNGTYLGSLPLVEIAHSMRNRDRLVGRMIESGVTEIFAPNSQVAIDYILKRA